MDLRSSEVDQRPQYNCSKIKMGNLTTQNDAKFIRSYVLKTAAESKTFNINPYRKLKSVGLHNNIFFFMIYIYNFDVVFR